MSDTVLHYKKKYSPDAAVIEAVKLTKENVSMVADWCTGQEVVEKDAFDSSIQYVGLNFLSWEGVARVSEGDYVIKDGLGEFHMRWAANFENDFERVNDEEDTTSSSDG